MSDPDALSTCLESAGELEQQGEFEAALSQYERAEALDGTSWPTRSRHVQLLYRIGRLARAQERLGDYLQNVQPAPGAALNDLGVLKAEQGQALDAIECFGEALRSPSPASSSVVWGNLAYILYAEDKREECAKACESALRLDPDAPRVHYILSAVEAIRFEGRLRPASRVVRGGGEVNVFRLLLLDGQSMTRHKAKIVGEQDPQVHIAETVSPAPPGTHWGILVSQQDKLWCGFSKQSSHRRVDTKPVVRLPSEFCLVQRRRWVRVLATGSTARLEVRSFPPGVKPFELEKLVELNLSGGGAAVRTVPELPPGAEVSLFLKFDEGEEMEVIARVTRIGRLQAAKAYSALCFVRLDEKDRDKIARFVHNVQLNRKRGPAHLGSQ